MFNEAREAMSDKERLRVLEGIVIDGESRDPFVVKNAKPTNTGQAPPAESAPPVDPRPRLIPNPFHGGWSIPGAFGPVQISGGFDVTLLTAYQGGPPMQHFDMIHDVDGQGFVTLHPPR